MRKTSVRKFIHMVIDILPLLIIPIFALNILHKETEPISIEVQEKISVDFNQLTNTNFSIEGQSKNGLIVEKDNNFIHVYGTSTQETYFAFANTIVPLNNIVISKYNVPSVSGQYRVGNFNNGSSITFSDTSTRYSVNAILSYGLQVYNNQSIDITFTYMTFDLTQMYGSGNEPTITEFNNMFDLLYYDYTQSQKMLVNKPSPTTYNSTDIGSQFIYVLYKPVNDYFNFNNLFNMGAIYNWIELNLFSGTAPLPIFIIWNVIVYEFFVDLIFLLYGVFMFIIDFAEKCLERPFRR